MRVVRDKAVRDKVYKENEISSRIASSSKKAVLFNYSRLSSATNRGLVLHSNKKFLQTEKKELSKFLNQPVELFLSLYELPFFGKLEKISEIKKDMFEISVGFTEDTPPYYRDCVQVLLN